jgi:hemoglobin
MTINFKYFAFALCILLGASTTALYAQETTEEEIPAEEESIPAEEETAVAAQEEKMQSVVMDSKAENPAPAHPELLPVFKQFGEEAGLIKLMDVFMEKLLADPRMRPFFENSDQAKVKKHLIEQFCVILGGPCSYSGRDMKSVHANLGINRANFNALVEDLQWAMNKQGIPFRAQNKLLAKLAPMHREIETK